MSELQESVSCFALILTAGSIYPIWTVSFCLFVCLFVCLSVCLSVCLTVCISVCLFLFVCLSVLLSVFQSVFLFVCLSGCLSVCLSVSLSVFLFICLSELHVLRVIYFQRIQVFKGFILIDRSSSLWWLWLILDWVRNVWQERSCTRLCFWYGQVLFS